MEEIDNKAIKIIKFHSGILLILFILNCYPYNVCYNHKDCPSDSLCVDMIKDEKGACIVPRYEGDPEDKANLLFKNIRHCSEDADCDDCSGDPDEEWGCLDKGGTIHNCMLKRDGKFQDPIVKELWKKCEKK